MLNDMHHVITVVMSTRRLQLTTQVMFVVLAMEHTKMMLNDSPGKSECSAPVKDGYMKSVL